MLQENLGALLGSALYFCALLLGTEWLERRTGWRESRELLQIGAGTGSLVIFHLFSSWHWGILPSLTLIPLAYLSYRYEWLAALEGRGRASLGPTFFAGSFTLLLASLWRPGAPEDRGFIAVAAILASAWGDALASVIGKRRGTRRYRILGQQRSMEGTLGFFFTATLVMTPVLAIYGDMEWHPSFAYSMVAATVAAAVESISPYGSDNLSVPVTTAVTLVLLAALGS